MNELISIPANRVLPLIEDYEALRKLGIEHIQKLAGKIWTDHNIHDPGITTLEFLCYAITDLANRTSFDMKDLLAPDPADSNPQPKNFHTAVEIFPCNPVTALDWRKLLIDVDGVKNAWVDCKDGPCPCEPAVYVDCKNETLSYKGTESLALEGMLDVKVLYDEDVAADSNLLKDAEYEVWSKLNQHRNLSEDFCNLRSVNYEEIGMCAEVEVNPDSDLNFIMAEIHYVIDEYLNPPVQFYSLKELLEKGKKVDQIFEGPVLTHGFIDADELQASERRTQIFTSDLINLIMDIEGVVAIRNFHMSNYVQGIPRSINETWCLDLYDPDCAVPLFSFSKSNFAFYKGELPFVVETNKMLSFLEDLKARRRKAKLGFLESDFGIPEGTYFDLDDYFPILNEFPLTYGVGNAGLPGSASQERINKAKQFKAYLLFFEQVMADYLTQLSHLRDLYSWPEADNPKTLFPTYHTQYLNEVENLVDCYDFGTNSPTHENLQTLLTGIAETESQRSDRRNRFLDHLLARFAETAADYSIRILEQVDYNVGDVLTDKALFLKDYPVLSRDRGKGFDQTSTSWGTENVSGLAKRIARKLGIADLSLRNLACYDIRILEVGGEFTAQVGLQVAPPDGGMFTSFRSITYSDRYVAEAAIEVLIANGSIRSYYTRNPSPASSYFWTFDHNGAVFTSDSFLEESDADDYLERIYTEFARLEEQDCEGLHIVEHILLRPRNMDLTDPMINTCIECCEETTLEDDIETQMQFTNCYQQSRINVQAAFSFKFTRTDCDSGALIEDILRGETNYTNIPDREAGLRRTRELAAFWENFSINTPQGGPYDEWFFAVDDPQSGARLARSTRDYDIANFNNDEEEARTALLADIQSLVAYFYGFYNPEFCLPVPEASGDSCDACNYENNPYAWKISVILPGYSPRFRNPAFREYAERQIRLETPAHVYPKICWISRLSMYRFEQIYNFWLTSLKAYRTNPRPVTINPSVTFEVVTSASGTDGVRVLLPGLNGDNPFQQFWRGTSTETLQALADQINSQYAQGYVDAVLNPPESGEEITSITITVNSCQFWGETGNHFNSGAISVGDMGAGILSGAATTVPESRTPPPPNSTLQEVLNSMEAMDNDYPFGNKLHDCLQGEDENILILNKSNLGNIITENEQPTTK